MARSAKSAGGKPAMRDLREQDTDLDSDITLDFDPNRPFDVTSTDTKESEGD